MQYVFILYIGAMVATITIILATAGVYLGLARTTRERDQERVEYERLRAKLPLATRWEDLSERIDDLEAELYEKQEDNRKASLIIEDAKKSEMWLDEHRDELLTLEAKIEQIEKVKAELDSKRKEREELDSRLSELTRDVDATEFKRDRIKEEIASIEHKQETETTRLDTIRDKVEQMHAKHNELNASLATLSQQVSQEGEKLQNLRNEANKQQGNLDKLNSETSTARIELQQIESAVKQKRSEIKALENSIDTLKALYNTVLEETKLKRPADQKESQAELWHPALHSNAKIRHDSHTEELLALSKVNDYLENLGLMFSQRTIYALHTALKTADESPILVLAGISGTGKSLLPRRYAEAMGIHFLSVPVQPRWDGPQDLFGFFNYLEGRYRPTELTRALIQMDRHKNVNGRGWEIGKEFVSHSDEMLLVLLDEMNLARVEYYFSDLLSKLETRRDILDVNDPRQREKAELTLEVGHRTSSKDKQASAMMRVFVGSNVMFVGTMNEDESTQTLSDKVIDRANLIRFGRPNSLTSKTNQHVEVPNVAPLQIETWQNKWTRNISNLPESSNHRLQQYIERLNDAMQSVGRPFAHRVHRAIKAYAANYPRQDETGLNMAIADQIEFRILPRFRGIDPAESSSKKALLDVERIVAELGDEDLARQIQNTSKRQDHLFIWPGLDRTENNV